MHTVYSDLKLQKMSFLLLTFGRAEFFLLCYYCIILICVLAFLHFLPFSLILREPPFKMALPLANKKKRKEKKRKDGCRP